LRLIRSSGGGYADHLAPGAEGGVAGKAVLIGGQVIGGVLVPCWQAVPRAASRKNVTTRSGQA